MKILSEDKILYIIRKRTSFVKRKTGIPALESRKICFQVETIYYSPRSVYIIKRNQNSDHC